MSPDTRLVFDEPGRVYAFVREKVKVPLTSNVKAIGLERRGELIAGVLYDGYTGPNVWMHVAAEPGRCWVTREFLHAVFAYPFVQLGCDRVSGAVDASNSQARRFDEHLGFSEEARLKGAAADGGDVILYVMWKKDCRYVDVPAQ